MAATRIHLHHSLPAPVVHAGFSISQSKSHVLAGVQDAYWSDDEAEDAECPLCLEEMDVSDLNFKPCICGYQICRFCWHHIKENLNKRCPACRRVYTDDAVEFKPIATQDHKRLTQQKKQRERERKELDTLGRRHLANVRVVQRNVVYVVGIGPRFAKEELIPTLRSNEYFGQYGKISKILLVKRTPSGGGPPVVGLYITYHRREDAARSIAAVDGTASPGGGKEPMRASYGTTKYCMAFLRGVTCTDHSCMNLHEWGDEKDCFTKEDLTTLKHTMKTTESRARNGVVTQRKGDDQDAGLPRAASWGQKPATSQAPTPSGNQPASSNLSATRQPRRGAVIRQSRNGPAAVSASSEARTTNQRASNEVPKSVPTTKASSQASSSRPATPASSLAHQRVPIPADQKPIRQKKETVPRLPSHSPDLSMTAGSDRESGQSEPISASPVVRPESADSTLAPQATPALPPGLRIAPPGLSAPPGIPAPSRPSRPDTASPQTPILASQTSYQMSTAARALLDDVKARRESALPATTGLSPFPDFDRTLQTLSGEDGGGFSFNLDPNLAGSDAEDISALPDFETESKIPFRGSYIDAFPALRTTPTSVATFPAPPGLPYPHHPNRSIYDPLAVRLSPIGGLEKQASGASGYMGPFNPFADGPEEPPAPSSSPLRRPQYSPADDESSRKVSRFGFARGRQGSTATSSPVHISSPLSNSNSDLQSFYTSPEGTSQMASRTQWPVNARQDYSQPGSAIGSPLVDGAESTVHLQAHISRFQPFDTGVSEAQLRELIQSSRERAQASQDMHAATIESQPPFFKFAPLGLNVAQFTDPAIMSARLASPGSEPAYNQMTYGPPPGLSYPSGGLNVASGNPLPHGGMEGLGSAHVSITASPVLSLALSASDFPALTSSPVEPSIHEESPPSDVQEPTPDTKAQEKAERKAAKKAAAVEKAAERQRIAQERAVAKAAERAKIVQEKNIEKERTTVLKAQEKSAREEAEKEKAAKLVKVESERLAQLQKDHASQAEREKEQEKQKGREKEEKQKKQSSKPGPDNRPEPTATASKAAQSVVTTKAAPASDPVSQLPLLSKKPKKNKPTAKPSKMPKEDGPVHNDTSMISNSDVPLLPADSSSNNSRSHSMDRNTPTPLEDLLEEVDILHPSLDIPNHPFFDLHKINPTATMPLEYGPLVHALSALSVGGGSFANNMPSGSIDNAVSSFQQLLETLTQTISDLLRLLPRTTWDDSSSFDGVLRDMLKGDDFLDDSGDGGHGKEDEVAALTLALERRARWMEVQLSKLEELHRDINTAAVRAVLSFNDNGWDMHGFMPRIGNTLRRFDSIGLIEEGGKVRSMTADELEKKLAVAKEAAVFAETEVREVMERMQSIRPVGGHL
ncbi:putative general negative regulator of transcription C16C9.04c [Hypsizygus marmoreus]|uniref:General negative regulator of transcription C16C9.04c n=1 Tax=Hypsizygus marmoreus TaxID=39966 RepID=A0A369JJQ1_HYPMA|nr:putative general negative regulator of transcription C16C9.04c [Hypsizygus marmoreus]